MLSHIMEVVRRTLKVEIVNSSRYTREPLHFSCFHRSISHFHYKTSITLHFNMSFCLMSVSDNIFKSNPYIHYAYSGGIFALAKIVLFQQIRNCFRFFFVFEQKIQQEAQCIFTIYVHPTYIL